MVFMVMHYQLLYIAQFQMNFTLTSLTCYVIDYVFMQFVLSFVGFFRRNSVEINYISLRYQLYKK